MTDITEKNRSAIQQIRRTPMPISDVIPLLTESNDAIEKLRGEVASLKAALKTEEALSFRNQVAQLEAELSAEREACAKVCDVLNQKAYDEPDDWAPWEVADACAAAIRARNV